MVVHGGRLDELVSGFAQIIQELGARDAVLPNRALALVCAVPTDATRIAEL